MNKKWLIYSLVSLLCLPWQLLTVAAAPEPLDLTVDAKSYLVIDSQNGQLLAAKDDDELTSVGGMSQLLTAYLVYQAIETGELSKETQVPISQRAYEMSQDYSIANVPLRQDEHYTVGELLEPIGTGLAHGATLALAELIGDGDEAKAIKQMEDQLADWQLSEEDAVIETVTGLPTQFEPHDEASYTKGQLNQFNARALATISYHLVHDFPEFLDYTQLTTLMFKEDTDDRFEINNWNQLMPDRSHPYEGATGLAADNFERVGGNLIASATKDDLSIIAVLLDSSDEDRLYSDMIRLLDLVFSSNQVEALIQEGQPLRNLAQVPVVNGKQKVAPLAFGQELNLVVPIIDTSPRLNYCFIPDSTLVDADGALIAPLEAGQTVGEVELSIRDYDLTYLPSASGNRVPVVLEESVEETNAIVRGYRTLTHWINSRWQSVRRFFVRLFNY